ncbi:hypothetical protein DPMN_024001 [Dreissena polymorpha]|uniref:Uncharacterized protein n=1 Tax=Dreissena polymorpha TaxID=45954 RepID=A0A9D4RB76_DREPO|nr:hypothetical protein DPMN_024001 [Dreissena polymorpha]
MLLTLDHEVKCRLSCCKITSCVEASDADTVTFASLKTGLNTTLKIKIGSPCHWEALHGLNIKSLTLIWAFEALEVNCVELLSQSLSSLTQLETLSIEAIKYSPVFLEALRGLHIKSLSLSQQIYRSWNHEKTLLQSLSSLTHLETLSIEMCEDSPGLWEALRGLNIKSLSVKKCNSLNYVELRSQSFSSLTHLETLSIEVYKDSPGLWEALHGLNIKTLSLSQLDLRMPRNWDHEETRSQSLSSLTKLETLTICVPKYIDIQLPKSLKYLNIYCGALLPSELRKLVYSLSASAQTVESRLEFGCADLTQTLDGYYLMIKRIHKISPEEYIAIQKELKTQKNVAVKRFQIFNRKHTTYWEDDIASSNWSVHDIGRVDDYYQDDDIVKDDPYIKFISRMGNEIINRISMRLLITPASIISS